MKNSCVIAVDAMGGDFAPDAPVKGACLAALEVKDGLRIVLVGDEKAIHAVGEDFSSVNITVENASEVISMDDSPVGALREKKDSSIAKVAHLLKDAKVDAIFSAGNTGAFMAASLLAVGKIQGINRPGLGVFYPTFQGTSFLMDIGANSDCKAHHLFHFGIMGATLVKYYKNIDNPSIGLLSIGAEDSKGDQATVEANKLFRRSGLNFKGNIEGHDVLPGSADVIVCDGFVGNILLKLFETLGLAFENVIQNEIGSNLLRKFGQRILKNPILQFKESCNYENRGGVPLLGINGVSIVGHGHSSPEAIKSGILTAKAIYERNIHQKIKQEIEQYKELN